MNGRAGGRTRRWVGVVAGLACAATVLAGEPVRAPALHVLQMNLCNSGQAGCYTGRSVAHAAAVIRAERPDVVTLSEVCDSDVAELAAALAHAHGGATIVPAFRAAVNSRTGLAVRCDNGRAYGVGLVARVPEAARGSLSRGGAYPVQINDGEDRVWLCLDVADAFRACTTHLANGSASVALDQCRHLLHTALPPNVSQTVIGADLNLGAADAQPCLPAGFQRVHDGGLQQVITSADLTIRSSRTIDMGGTTDHAALLATVSPR